MKTTTSDEIKKIIETIENRKTEKQKILPTKTDYTKLLNKKQLEGAITTKGNVLIIAGAGTGKTRTLIHRASYIIETENKPQEILMVTFTKKAAEEIKERIKEITNQKIETGTFHAIAHKWLQQYIKSNKNQENYTIIDEEDKKIAIEMIQENLGKKFSPPAKKYKQ